MHNLYYNAVLSLLTCKINNFKWVCQAPAFWHEYIMFTKPDKLHMRHTNHVLSGWNEIETKYSDTFKYTDTHEMINTIYQVK